MSQGKTAPFSFTPPSPGGFTSYRLEKGRYFQVRGAQIHLSPTYIAFFLCLTHPFSQFLWLASSEPCDSLVLSMCTAYTNHPPSSSLCPPALGCCHHSPDWLPTALNSVSPAHPPQHARTIFLKHSYKPVFLRVPNAVNSHCPPH